MKTVVSLFGIEPFRIGGTEALARELSIQLGRRGWRSVLCYDKPPVEMVRRYLDLPNVSLEVVQDSWKPKWQPAVDVARILRRYQPDILHLHFTGFLGPYPRLAQLHSVKRVFFSDQTSHNASFSSKRAPLWKRAAARLINGPLTGVVCASDYNRQIMSARDLVPAKRIHRIYNSVDTSFDDNTLEQAARFRQRYSIPKERAIVAQVCAMTMEKGVEDFLRAACLVLARKQEVHFVLAGEGPYREYHMRLSAQMGLENHVTWTGLVEHPLADGVYAAADVVSLLSTWEEAFGYVIAEAMLSQRPVIGTRVGGIPEVIQHEESGFLVPRGDPQAAAEKILQLLEDPALRERMGRAGRQIVEAKFNLSRNVASLLELYAIA